MSKNLQLEKGDSHTYVSPNNKFSNNSIGDLYLNLNLLKLNQIKIQFLGVS